MMRGNNLLTVYCTEIPQKRKCLKCNHEFISIGKGNRICVKCKRNYKREYTGPRVYRITRS